MLQKTSTRMLIDLYVSFLKTNGKRNTALELGTLKHCSQKEGKKKKNIFWIFFSSLIHIGLEKMTQYESHRQVLFHNPLFYLAQDMPGLGARSTSRRQPRSATSCSSQQKASIYTATDLGCSGKNVSGAFQDICLCQIKHLKTLLHRFRASQGSQ